MAVRHARKCQTPIGVGKIQRRATASRPTANLHPASTALHSCGSGVSVSFFQNIQQKTVTHLILGNGKADGISTSVVFEGPARFIKTNLLKRLLNSLINSRRRVSGAAGTARDVNISSIRSVSTLEESYTRRRCRQPLDAAASDAKMNRADRAWGFFDFKTIGTRSKPFQMVRMQFAVQRAAAHAEFGRRLGPVAIGILQRPHQQLLLRFLHRQIAPRQHRLRFSARRAAALRGPTAADRAP